MANILLINGPNLNLLGKREPSIYGDKDLEQIEQELIDKASQLNCNLECFQSNSESEIVDLIQQKSTSTDVISQSYATKEKNSTNLGEGDYDPF